MLIKKIFLVLYIIITILFFKVNGYEKCIYQCIDPGSRILGRRHIMCLNEHQCHIVAQRCSNYIRNSLGFDEDEKEQILHLHNDLRNKIALGFKNPAFPAASNMRKLTWHQELADVTQCYVNACPHKYGLDICLDLYGAKVVTNEANVPFSKHIENWVSAWFQEQYSFKDIYSNYYDASFPKLIWADTEYIGCGKIIYFSGVHATKMVFIVCSYLPGGKINGQRIYKKGKAASDCPNDTQSDEEYKGLCSTKLVNYQRSGQKFRRVANFLPVKRVAYTEGPTRPKEIHFKSAKNESEHSKARIHGFAIILLCLSVLYLTI